MAIAAERYVKFKIVIVKNLNLKKNFVIVSVYFPPSLDPVEFTRINYRVFLFLRPFREVLVLGDFNDNSKLWGDRLTTSKWNTIAEVVDFYNFMVLNDGGYTFKYWFGSRFVLL